MIFKPRKGSRFFISVLIVIGFGLILKGQSAKHAMNWTNVFYVQKIEAELSIVYDGQLMVGGEMKDLYSLSWEDTLGSKGNYEKFNRPYELHVVVRDKDTIVGSYTGLSAQMTHCNFFTNSRKVEVFFFKGINKFYERPKPVQINKESPKDEGLTVVEVLPVNIDDLDFYNSHFAEYEPIKVNLKSRKLNYIDGFEEKKLVLSGNNNIVTLNHVNKGAMYPDEMPRVGPSYCQIMALDRYQINEETGRIRKGKSWIFWKGIRRCCDATFTIVDPHLTYVDEFGKTCTGKQLIRRRKLSKKKFNLFQFDYITGSLPY
jgi:hypothetical protein